MAAESAIKNIIPHLVSLDTDLKKISGFHLSENFDFFQSSGKNKFHYKVIINEFEIPKKYDFRNEYYFKANDKWYYERIIKGLTFKFSYDVAEKVFTFNKFYNLLPFRLGGIFRVGEHLTHLIILELFLNDYIYLRGCALKYNNKVICIAAPGYNGKTFLVNEILKKGGKYISEDHLIINFKENIVFPTCPFINKSLFTKESNRQLSDLITHENILTEPQTIDSLFLVCNSLNNSFANKKSLGDYLFLDSLIFLDNLFMRSFIFEEGLRKRISEKINEITKWQTNFDFVNIYNFHYNQIIN